MAHAPTWSCSRFLASQLQGTGCKAAGVGGYSPVLVTTTPTSLMGFNHPKILGIREGFCKGMGAFRPRYALCGALFWPGRTQRVQSGAGQNLLGPHECPLGPHAWGLAQATIPSAAAIAELEEGLHGPPGQPVSREPQQLCAEPMKSGAPGLPLACPIRGPALPWALGEASVTRVL